MRGVHSAEDDHTGLILLLVGSQTEAFIVGRRKHVILKLKKNKADINEAAVL